MHKVEKLGRVARAAELYFHTLRHLKPVQFYGRALFRLARPRPDLSPPPPLGTRSGQWVVPARRAPSLAGPGHFQFLNESGLLSETGWDDPRREKLWRYNQHYFDDLNARDAQNRRDWHMALIGEWIAGNPPGQGTGWEPYPLSLRMVNWIKWALAGNELPPDAIESLAIQARWLTRRLEWHLLGNHLFANAKALVFVGLYFAGDEASRWRDLGFRILEREFREQILPDGGQFERSPMYHALAIEDVLDLVNVCTCFASELNTAQVGQVMHWRETAPSMLRWLEAMCHPDGEIAFFNDAAIGIAPDKAELKRYARQLGLKATVRLEDIVWLRDSGYARLAREPAVLIADVGPVGPDYLPGHAHADTLSFEFSLHGQRIIVNSGTSQYGSGAERLRQRGTAAHSTLVLDGCDSSQVWSGFRVGRRARPFDVEVTETARALLLQAAHDGYTRLHGRPIHHREWQLAKGELKVRDTVSGVGGHRAEILFHLAPGLVPMQTDERTWQICSKATRGIHATVEFDAADVKKIQSSWHPQFGLTLPSWALSASLSGPCPLEHQTVFRWGDL